MEQLIQLDHELLILINKTLANSFFDWLMPLITDLHKTSFFKMGFVPFLYCLMIRQRGAAKGSQLFLVLLVTLGLSDFLGSQLFKKNFQRLRPGDNPSVSVEVRSGYGGYSFTSNHATNMAASATFVYFFFPKAFAFVAVFAGLVIYSRVYNGVHFPADVLVGALFGVLVAQITARAYKKIARSEGST